MSKKLNLYFLDMNIDDPRTCILGSEYIGTERIFVHICKEKNKNINPKIGKTIKLDSFKEFKRLVNKEDFIEKYFDILNFLNTKIDVWYPGNKIKEPCLKQLKKFISKLDNEEKLLFEVLD